MPDAVYDEVVREERLGESDLYILQNLQRHTLPKHRVEDFIKSHKLAMLHAGECECLYLCAQKNISLILTDDLAARKFAKQLKCTPVGSLGIIAKAYHQHTINLEEAEKYLVQLYEMSSLYVSRAIVGAAIEQLRKSSKHT